MGTPKVMNGGFSGGAPHKNRVVAIVKFFDPDHRLVGGAVSIIARPFAERTFHVHLFLGRRHFAFDGDFRRRRNR